MPLRTSFGPVETWFEEAFRPRDGLVSTYAWIETQARAAGLTPPGSPPGP